MKKLVLASVIVLMGASLAMARPIHHRAGPVVGFQISGFTPNVWFNVYLGPPIFIGPTYPDGWGYWGPPRHRHWGWFHDGYFHRWDHDRWDHDRDHDRGWDRDHHSYPWGDNDRRDFDRRDDSRQWDRDHQDGGDHRGGNDHSQRRHSGRH